jgi:hypothetical protein
MQLRSEKFSCACHSGEHRVEFAYDSDMLYFTIHLTGISFWQRVSHALKYIFGYKCKYGNWDQVLLSDEQVKKLSELIHEYSYDKRNFMEGTKTRILNDKEKEYDSI